MTSISVRASSARGRGLLRGVLTCVIEEPTDVRIKHPVDIALLNAHRHRIERIMWAATRSKTIGESAKLFLVDGVQHCHRGPLDDLIFQCRDADGPLAAIRLRDVHPLDRTRVVPPSLEAV